MEHCAAHKKVTSEVKEFMQRVDGVGEESITDYLLWKWEKINDKFKSIKVSSFTRQEESSTSGADFEMEVWLVGRNVNYPLVFQAKKFTKPYDAYVTKLRYPGNTKSQMDTLLKYSASTGKIPFYAFYSIPDAKTETMCAKNDAFDCGVFMADAKVIEEFADKKRGRKVSKNDLLKESNPFHCMFCCPLAGKGDLEYFKHYFSSAGSETLNQDLPEYADYLLKVPVSELDGEKLVQLIEKYNLKKFKHVAVYDMRQIEPSPHKEFNKTIR
ncbi:MAG: hypothetical protein HWE34_02055 [Methylocystaceae bacterium]|nr:hypothetical protein [Methylocystaceae bacterium]